VFGKQIYLQELENKCVEIEKKNDTISTLRGEFDVKDATINNLKSQIKDKNDTLLKKSNAITKLIKSSLIKENRIKELEAQIGSKDAALEQKVKTITEVNLSNSTKDDGIKYLEAQVKEKENSIAALKDKLANHIINGGYPKQEVECLIEEIRKEKRGHDKTWRLSPFNTNPIRYFGRSRKRASTSRRQGHAQSGVPSDQRQGYDPRSISFQQTAKAASIAWSITVIDPRRPRLPRLRGEIDAQLLDDGIHGWLSGIRESDMRPICSRSRDSQYID
jgi:uncharacterized coiled-coil protein SlyX